MNKFTALVSLIFLISLGSRAQVPTNGLVAYYPLSGNANDYSGNGNNGTATNAQTTTDRFGRANEAYLFGGYYNPGYIHVPNSASLQFTTGAAVSVWVRVDSTAGSDINNNYAALGTYGVFSKDWDEDGVAGNVVFWSPPQVYIYADEVTGEPFQPLSAYTHVDSAGVILSKWVHIVFNLALDTPRIYINGRRIAGGDTTHYNFASTNQNDLYFGKYSTGWYPLAGALDDIRIYNRTLADAEIQSLYNEYDPAEPESFMVSLTVSPPGPHTTTLKFGAVAGATDGIDTSLGERELPPIPPLGSFDARWVVGNTDGTYNDYEDTLGGSHNTDTFVGRVQLALPGDSATITWPSVMPPGTFILEDAATGGGTYVVDMTTQSSFVVKDSTSMPFQIVYDRRQTIVAQVSAGWNMASIPITGVRGVYSSLIPQAVTRPFAFINSAYTAQDTLAAGMGFWIKFGAAGSMLFHGDPVQAETIAVLAGWNMIGAPGWTVPVGALQTIPSSILISPFYGYYIGYFEASSLVPANAYWVKASADGLIIVEQPSGRSSHVVTRGGQGAKKTPVTGTKN